MTVLRFFLSLAMTSALLGVVPPEAFAQENKFIVRPKIYERLQKAQKALKDNKFANAKREIGIIQKRMKPNKHEQALTLQALGYVYAAEEKYSESAKILMQAWELNSLPAATQNSLIYNTGQILLAAKKYKQAVVAFDRWIKVVEKPAGSALYTVAAAKYQAKDIAGAADFANRAVRSGKAKDSWLRLLLSANIQLKRWKPAISTLTRLMNRNASKRTDWIQLVALYQEAKDDKRALAVMQLAHEAGVLEKRTDFVQLAQRYQSQDIPISAAEVLLDAVKGKKVKMDKEVSKMIAESFFVARDDDRAGPALARAARMAANGELYIRLAQLELENEKWGKAIDAGKKAVAKGGLKSPGKAHLLIGIAEARRGRTAAAAKAFKLAAKSPSVAKSAQGWMKYLSSVGASDATAAP